MGGGKGGGRGRRSGTALHLKGVAKGVAAIDGARRPVARHLARGAGGTSGKVGGIFLILLLLLLLLLAASGVVSAALVAP